MASSPPPVNAGSPKYTHYIMAINPKDPEHRLDYDPFTSLGDAAEAAKLAAAEHPDSHFVVLEVVQVFAMVPEVKMTFSRRG